MRLPWMFYRHLSVAIAWLMYGLNVRESRVTRRNLELVLSSLAPSERVVLQRRVLQSTALQTFEMLRTWTHSPAENLGRIRCVYGEEIFRSARARQRGVIVAAPHFGNWELLNQWLAHQGPIAIVYRPGRSAVIDAFLKHVRGIPDVVQVKAEATAVRQLFKVLNAGGTIGILPDQQPKLGEGVFAPFFGVKALTMTLISRLARRTEATIIFAWCQRRGTEFAFDLHFVQADSLLSSSDPIQAATALNRGIERIVQRDMAQYQWTYKRYTLRPPEEKQANDPYRTRKHPH